MKVEAKKKKPYSKPKMKEVLLKPDEAVLGFCRNSGKSGPFGSGCPGSHTTYCIGTGS